MTHKVVIQLTLDIDTPRMNSQEHIDRDIFRIIRDELSINGYGSSSGESLRLVSGKVKVVSIDLGIVEKVIRIKP